MDIPSILLAVVVFLAATAICVILFERLGFGAILGFIVAGVIIGPHTPGPVPVRAVDEVQSVAELDVLLLMFTVGLEMCREKVWATQEAAGLGKAAAVYVTSRDMDRAKAMAITLHRLSPHLAIYVRVRRLPDQNELVAKGIRHAGTGYLESALVGGSMLLRDLGVSEDDVSELVNDFQQNDYALIRAAYAEVENR
jgi:hypothetical protein